MRTFLVDPRVACGLYELAAPVTNRLTALHAILARRPRLEPQSGVAGRAALGRHVMRQGFQD